MRFPVLSSLWLVLLAASAAAQAPGGGFDTARDYAIRVRAGGQRYVADELLIGLAPGATRESVAAEIEARGARVIGELALVRALRVLLPAGAEPLGELARFASIAGVRYAEPHDVGEGGWLGSSGDTHYASQWHHENTGQGGGTPGADIETLAAWSLAPNPAPIVLAVLDSGIYFTHPEFQARVVPGYDYVNEDADATADHAHGIYCTGLAAAATGNGFGVAGVDRTCTIYPLKVLNAVNGGTVADLVQGLQDCAVNQVDVVSMSLINYGNGITLENALVAARNAGCILVACAGNGGIGNADVSGPGQSAQTISIGATTRWDRRAGYSGTGGRLDFVAPGDLVATVSTSLANTFTNFSGCSAATPVAAGIVCLLKGQDPSLTQAQVYDLLKQGAEDRVGLPAEDTPGDDLYMGWGRLNARRTLASLTPCAAPLSYGTGKRTSRGEIPVLASTGLPRRSFGNFAVTLERAIPREIAFLFHGFESESVPWLGGTLLVRPPLVRLPARKLGALGQGAWPIPVGAGDFGTHRYFQAWFRDAAHPDGTGSGLSNGLAVTFCP